MASPSWLGASAGNAANAGMINQFLAGHTSSWGYGGAVQASQATGAALYVSSQSTYLGQRFTTGVSQTTIGQVWLQVSTVGGSPTTATITPLTVSLYADSSGTPTGSALATTSVGEQYVYSSPFWLPIPFAVTGLTASTPYWIITSPAGTGSAYYAWQRSNQTSGAATSPDNTTWTTQTYGLMYEVYDLTAGTGSVPQFLYDDAGARWALITYDAFGRISTLTEYCAAQNGTPLQSVRTFTYTNGFLTGVS